MFAAQPIPFLVAKARKVMESAAQVMNQPTSKIIASDVDGVLTDGFVWIDENGNELKRLFFPDLDALFDLHRNGFTLVFLTGEEGKWVDMVKKRVPYKYFYAGCRDKRSALLEVLRLENGEKEDLCYIGDGLSDVPALELAGIAVAPASAILEARAAADVVLTAHGGQGAIVELARLLKSGELKSAATGLPG